MKFQLILMMATLALLASAMPNNSNNQGIELARKFYRHKDLRLYGHFRQSRTEDVNECMNECTKTSECKAISFHDDTHHADFGQDCFMFKDIGSFYGEARANWTSYLLNGQFDQKLVQVYDRVHLFSSKSFNVLDKLSLDECWLACDRNSKASSCVAVSYNQETKSCHQFAQGQYQSETKSDDKWTSIAYQEEKVLEYTMYRERAIKLQGHFATYKTNNDMACWNQCEKLSLCDAMSFSLERNECLFFNVDRSFAVQDAKWNSYFESEFDKPVAKIFPGIRLTNHFGSVVTMLSEEDCWLECQKTDACVAITYSRAAGDDKSKCYKFKKSAYAAVEDSACTSIALESESKHLTGESIMYANKDLALFNSYHIDFNISFADCATKCNKDQNCRAICVRVAKDEWDSNYCYYFSEGNHYGETDSQYMSYTKKKPFGHELTRTYLDLNVFNSYKKVTARNFKFCWIECQNRKNEGCVVSKFQAGECWLHRKGEYRTEKKSPSGSIVLALETERAEEQNMYKSDKLELMNYFKEYKARSIDECWRVCLKNDQCQSIKYHKDQSNKQFSKRCFLFKEDQYFGIQNPNWQAYHKKEFKKPLAAYYNNTRLFDHFHGFVARSLEDCWLECMKTSECAAITLRPGDNFCFFFKPNHFASGVGQSWQSMTMVGKGILMDHSAHKRRDVELHSPYVSFVANEIENCWAECTKDVVCEAMNYNHDAASKKCQLFKKDDFFASKMAGQTSFFKKHYDKPLVNIYEQTQLVGSYSNLATENKDKCWLKCTADKDCQAISFDSNKKVCHFYKSDEFREMKEPGWQTIAPEGVEVQGQTMFKRRDIRLSNPYKSVNIGVANIGDCWKQCHQAVDCSAMSYLDTPRECKLYNSVNFTPENAKNWMSYFKRQPSF